MKHDIDKSVEAARDLLEQAYSAGVADGRHAGLQTAERIAAWLTAEGPAEVVLENVRLWARNALRRAGIELPGGLQPDRVDNGFVTFCDSCTAGRGKCTELGDCYDMADAFAAGEHSGRAEERERCLADIDAVTHGTDEPAVSKSLALAAKTRITQRAIRAMGDDQ